MMVERVVALRPKGMGHSTARPFCFCNLLKQQKENIVSTATKTVLVALSSVIFSASMLAADKPAMEAQTGTVAYYSHVFEGRPTSNQGVFRSGKMTAASATLPLGTKVRITNIKNNRSVVLRITDR